MYNLKEVGKKSINAEEKICEFMVVKKEARRQNKARRSPKINLRIILSI